MNRTQLKRSIRWEAVIISVLGTVVGIVLALVLGRAMMKALEPSGLTMFAGARSGRWSCCSSAAPLVGTVAADLPGPPGGQARRSSTPSPTSRPWRTNACSYSAGASVFTEIEVAPGRVTWQPSLLAIDEPDFDPTLAGARRRFLGRGRVGRRGARAGVTGADVLFDTVLESAPWKAFERPMYDRVVDVPRLETRAWPDRPAGARPHGPLPRPPLRRAAAVDLRQPLPRRARLRRVARRPHRPHARRRGRGDPLARLHPHAPAAPRRRRRRRSPSRCTPATCSCRAAPASAPSSTASPSAPTPAPASASCSASRAATDVVVGRLRRPRAGGRGGRRRPAEPPSQVGLRRSSAPHAPPQIPAASVLAWLGTRGRRWPRSSGSRTGTGWRCSARRRVRDRRPAAGVEPRTSARGASDVIVSFHTSRADLATRLPTLMRALDVDGGLWISWPKQAVRRRRPTSPRTSIREVALPTGLVDVKVCAVDDTWSGLRLCLRKELRAGRTTAAG